MDKKKDKIMKIIGEFIKKVKENINVDRLILFGSRARGDFTKESDVDLIIISKDFEGIKFFRRAPQLYRLWNEPYDIDIVCLTPKEFAQKIKEIGIMGTVIKEGVEL